MRIMSEKPRPDDPGDLPEHNEPGNHLWENPVMQPEAGRVNISSPGRANPSANEGARSVEVNTHPRPRPAKEK